MKLYFQSRESATSVLRSYHLRKGVRTGKGPMTSSSIKRIISKLEATWFLDVRPRMGRSSTSAHTAWTVQEEMDIITGSSTHEEIRAREIARRNGIPWTTVWAIGLRRKLLSIHGKFNVIMNCFPAILWSRKHLRCACFKRWRKMPIGCLTCCGPTKPISHVESLSSLRTAESGLLKIPELSYKFHCTMRKFRCGVNLPHLPASTIIELIFSRKWVIVVLKHLAWQVLPIWCDSVRQYVTK